MKKVNFMSFFRRLGGQISRCLTRFMAGRYGSDKLNMAILGAGLLLCVVSMFINWVVPDLVLTFLSYALMIWAIFRMLSRNTYKRYRENRAYLNFLQRLKDKEHLYFTCPRCHQTVRVPRGKGKILITCPKCSEKFQKKT